MMNNQKVWFITGASKGFGLEISRAALAAGDQVVATVRKDPQQLIDAMSAPANLLVVVLDVTKEEQVKKGVSQALDRFGRIDVLVNNAGYGLIGATEEASDAEAKKQFDTNVFGSLNMIRIILPTMRSQHSGHIINISSFYSYGINIPGLGLYAATKYAIQGISEGLALEVGPLGIKVTSVAPGLFTTDFTSDTSYKTSEKVIGDYDATVGQVRTVIRQLHGNQPGDPKKLAAVIVTIANTDTPPLHLLIGSDAIRAYNEFAERNAREVAKWGELSASTDHIK